MIEERPFLLEAVCHIAGMKKRKRKRTAAEKAEKKRRREEFMTVFVNGKQKRVKRPPTIDGVPVDEFIRNNADPVWLLQEGMYEELHRREQERDAELDFPMGSASGVGERDEDEGLPF
jgi:hypothetical protein